MYMYIYIPTLLGTGVRLHKNTNMWKHKYGHTYPGVLVLTGPGPGSEPGPGTGAGAGICVMLYRIHLESYDSLQFDVFLLFWVAIISKDLLWPGPAPGGRVGVRICVILDYGIIDLLTI